MNTTTEEIRLWKNREEPLTYLIKRFGLGDTTATGPFWVELNGNMIGEDGRTHWYTEEQAREFIKRNTDIIDGRKPRMPADNMTIIEGVDQLCKIAHANSANAGWWNCPDTDEDLLSNPSYAPYVLATKMMLIVSETAEAMEGLRKDLPDDKLPQYSMEGCELADIMIRVADYAGKRGIPLGQIIVDKMGFNVVRPDHQVSNRRKPGGKKF